MCNHTSVIIMSKEHQEKGIEMWTYIQYSTWHNLRQLRHPNFQIESDCVRISHGNFVTHTKPMPMLTGRLQFHPCNKGSHGIVGFAAN